MFKKLIMLPSLIQEVHSSWKELFNIESKKDYFQKLDAFLTKECFKNQVYPEQELIFNAFKKASFSQLKVVILGQDPYHGTGEAHGLSFSVPQGIKIPPSLRNIYKELYTDLGIEPPGHGNLDSWADQGVLLLNATLTVRKDSPGSHQKKGWEQFTDTIIRTIATQRKNIVFILWGNFAKQKEHLIDSNKHLVLKSAHPSPFSAHSGFFGCRHFSKANTYLIEKGKKPIDWQIPESGLFRRV